MMYGILLGSMLGGCRGFLDRQTTCDFDVYDWWPGLATHVNQDRDAVFDYDPGDAPIARVSGSYDPSEGSGDFQFLVEYADGYFLEKSVATGYGTVYFGGDLDLLYETTTRDVLGEDVKMRVREKRHLCSGLKKFTNLDTDEGWILSYDITSEDEVISTISTDEPNNVYTERRIERSDYSVDTILSAEGTGWSREEVATVYVTGIRESTWSQEDSSDEMAGITTRYFDGSEVSEYSWAQDGEHVADITANYEYDGSGTSLYVYEDGSSCDVEVDDAGECIYTCSDGNSGDC
jgi:hypothetical protein